MVEQRLVEYTPPGADLPVIVLVDRRSPSDWEISWRAAAWLDSLLRGGDEPFARIMLRHEVWKGGSWVEARRVEYDRRQPDRPVR